MTAHNAKRTPEVIGAILDALRRGCFRNGACISAGISYQTLLRWMHADPGLLFEVQRAEQELEERVVRSILDDERDQRTKLKWLGMRYPKHYRERTEKKITHSVRDIPLEQLQREIDEAIVRRAQARREAN
jgi:hypothetical protein